MIVPQMVLVPQEHADNTDAASSRLLSPVCLVMLTTLFSLFREIHSLSDSDKYYAGKSPFRRGVWD